jgi:hypothetical protein
MVGADPAQPDHARLGQLLQARGVQAHPEQPGPLRLVAGDPVAQDAAPAGEGRTSAGPSPPRRGGGSRSRQTGSNCPACKPCRSPGTGTGAARSPAPGSSTTPETAGTVESPVPGDGCAGFGERPGETGQEQSGYRAPGRLNRAADCVDVGSMPINTLAVHIRTLCSPCQRPVVLAKLTRPPGEQGHPAVLPVVAGQFPGVEQRGADLHRLAPGPRCQPDAVAGS